MEKMVSQTKIVAWPSYFQNWNYKSTSVIVSKYLLFKVQAFSDSCGGICCQMSHDNPLDSMNEQPTYLLPDKQLRIYFDDPGKCPKGETKIREKLPLKHMPVKVDYGENISIEVVYIEHTIAVGLIFTVIAVLSIIFALWWTIQRNDISGGFGAPACVFALITLGIGVKRFL
jgi:hypothetical protein